MSMGLPETLRGKTSEPLSLRSILTDYFQLLKNPRYRFYVSLSALSYGGLFAFISGSSFVLQQHYGLDAMLFGISFSLVVVGYISGTLLAARLVVKSGIDHTIGIGTAALAIGGTVMAVAFLFGPVSPFAILVPMMIYTLGVGLVMPQSMAGAMSPFPDRAGTASSMLGLIQMVFAAFGGLLLGHLLEWGAWPLPIMIAIFGLGAFCRSTFRTV